MGKRQALLIHGWRVRDPNRSVGFLAAPLAALGYEPVMLNYGFTLTAGRTRFVSNKAAKNWSARTQPTDIVIGHSNGARIAWEMSHTGQCLADTMVWINPSLDPECVPGRSVRQLLVLYSQQDWAVRLGSVLPNSIWGRMGYDGYCPGDDLGPDPRITCAIHPFGHSPWRNPAKLALTIHRWVLGNPVLMSA